MNADDLFSDLAPARQASGGTSGTSSSSADSLFADLAPPEPKRNAFAYSNDFMIDTANAAAGLAKAGVDLVAPGSAPSKAIEGFIESGHQSQSDWKRAQRANLSRNLANADGELDKAGIYLKHAITEDPIGTAAEVAGNLGPFGAVGKALQGTNAAVRTGTTMGLAGGLSAGEVRGNIHEKIDGTPDTELQASSPEYARLRQTMSEADAKAQIGSSFSRNAPEILAAGAIGAVGGKYGLEGMAARVAPARGRLANAAIGVADEATQGAVEQLASNVGIRRALPDQRLLEDVALNAAAEGILGLGGAVVGPTRGARATQPDGGIFDVEAARAPTGQATQQDRQANTAPAVAPDGAGQATIEGVHTMDTPQAPTPDTPAPLPSELMGLDPNAGPMSAAAALAVDSGAALPAEAPMAAGPMSQAAAIETDSEGGDTDMLPSPDFGEFAAFTQQQAPIPLENAQRLAGWMSEDGSAVMVVPNADGTGFGIAPAESLTSEQRAAVARFQPQSPDTGWGWADTAPQPAVETTATQTQSALPDVSGRTADQLQYLASNGQAGWKEAAQAELTRRATASGSGDTLTAAASSTQQTPAELSTTAAGELWATMAPAERQAVANLAGLNPVQRGNVPARPWRQLSGELQNRLTQAMQANPQPAAANQTVHTSPAARWNAMPAEQRQQIAARAGWATKAGAPNVIAKRHAGKTWQELDDFIRGKLSAALPAESPATAPATAQAPAPRFQVLRPDGSLFGQYSHRPDAEGALWRAGANARLIDTTTAPEAATPRQEATNATPDPYPHIDTRPDTTDAQRSTGRSALADLQRRIIGASAARRRGPDGSQPTVLGSALYEGFTAGRANQLTGLRIDGPADLASLAQVYRDPRFETFRTFFVKDGRIVGETGVTSRMPAAVALPPVDVFDDSLRENMARFGADGFYILHNHPSGHAAPSGADISITTRLAETHPEAFRGHVVIDHNEYSVIDARGRAETIKAPELAGIDFKSRPELEHELLGVKLSRPKDVAMMGKILQVQNGHATIITTDRRLRVQLLVDLPAALLKDRSKVGIARLKAVVRRAARETGSGGSRFLVLPENGHAAHFDFLMREGIFKDVVQADGLALSESGVEAARDFMDSGLRSIAMREEASPYTATDSAPPPQRLTVGEWLAHALRSNRGWAMGALTRDQITDIWGDAMPGVKRFDDVVRQMDTVRQRTAERADNLIEQWRQLPSEVSDRMSDLMHRATLAQFDPDAQRQGGEFNAEQAEMMRLWDSLPNTAKDIYREVRDTYRDTLSSIRDGLANRAEMAGTNGARVAAQIRLEFDNYLKDGPYFPLARFGDLVLIADKGKERMVETFESSARREMRMRQLRATGWTVKATHKAQYSATRDGAAGQFVGDVLERINALDLPAAEKANLMDNLNQLAIGTLPDSSYRRHFRHRKGVPGFSSDAMRAFAASMQHAGHHIAKIQHAHELSLLIDEMQKDIREAGGDTTEQQQVVNELTRRLDLLLNPNTHPVAAAAGQVGFVMSLGGSIASGLVNLTQTPFVTLPWLGARYGFGKASAAMTKASKDYFGGRWEKWSGFVMQGNPNLSADEQKAIRELENMGLINLTQAQDLAGTANTDSTVSKRAFAINRAMKIVGWTFHVPEVFNRQVSALATYRLARDKGQAHADAVEAARNALIRTHFDYSASNRARFMQGNFTRVITMFKQYSQQMTYLLWRNAYQALKGESPQVKREARRMLLGVAAMHFTAAGTLGLPLGIFGITPLLSLLALGMGDEDDPWEWETEYRKMLADVFGVKVGEAIAHGPMRMLLNVDMASRVGLGDLWLRAPNKEAEGRDLVEAWMLTLLGPVAGYAGQMGTAMQAFEEGKFARGVESMMPKFISAPLKAYRFSDEGVRSWRGDDLGIDLTPAEIVGTAMGFQPSRMAEMYEGRAAVKGREARLQARRSEILNMWVAATMAGDRETQQEAITLAQRFSRQNPAFAFNALSFQQAYRTKLRNAAQIRDGIFLSPKREGLREEGAFANLE
ncbi:PLxRFG domain-containing protein [Thauera sp. Sel9]|uniref:PLxRFG domain-containing protein n=1 Tax=Thauera sp. Sel9 TaxID=2974299 RepID=UPI0021E12219|nr:PLxRFG domain-containing protein [Thauera sp. Sel9]MCV2218893.1 PLxRFG domain-containing protein [Thauera sp. Sel9]